MALTITCPNDAVMSIEEYLQYVLDEVDVSDIDAIAASAPALQSLGNNRDLVADIFNQNLKNFLAGGRTTQYSPQSFVIGGKRTDKKMFFVRGNVWCPIAQQAAMRALEERVFSYHIAHDHNFHFMTVGYYGPGYETDIYEYDHAKVQGYVDEPVELRFLERTGLPRGKVMLYRPSVDVHLQLPPAELSISLNLMVLEPELQARDQYFFDVDAGRIAGLPYSAAVFQRNTLIQLAGHIGNGHTVDLLHRLAASDSNRRTRVAALDSMVRLAPAGVETVLRGHADDADTMVRTYARTALEAAAQPSALERLRGGLGLSYRQEVSTLARKGLGEALH